MKKANAIFIVFLFGIGGACCLADSVDDFVSSINQAWSQTNNTQVLQIIDTRLASNSNDVLAVSAKMYYYVFAEGSLTNARSMADRFMTIVNASTNAELKAYGQGMRDEVYSIPLSESGPYTDAQKAQLRHPSDAFPFVQKCVVITRWLSR
jgi:hypothetical protein